MTLLMGAGTLRETRRRAPLGIAASAGVTVLLLLFPLFKVNAYLLDVVLLGFMAAVLGVAWNIIGGYAGQPALGNVLFFGVGAYASAVSAVHWALNPWIAMLGGVALACAAAAVSGYPCFRLRGHQFALTTLAIALIALELFQLWPAVGAAVGLSIPLGKGGFGNLQFQTARPYYYLFLALLVLSLTISWAIRRSRTGYYLRAIRGDEHAAHSVGIPVSHYKLKAYLWTAALTSVAGSLYAQFTLFVDPSSVFNWNISIQALLVAMVGGIGTLWGPVVGAAVLTGLGEITRVKLGGTGSATDQVVYGALVVLFAVFEPRGLNGLVDRFVVARRRRSGAAIPGQPAGSVSAAARGSNTSREGGAIADAYPHS